MPKPRRNSTVDMMKTWKVECEQSVQQLTIRNMTTKDSTLPLNYYESKEADPKLVDFAELAQGGQEIATEEEKAPNQSSASVVVAIVFEGTSVCVKNCGQLRIQLSPFYLARLAIMFRFARSCNNCNLSQMSKILKIRRQVITRTHDFCAFSEKLPILRQTAKIV